MKTGKIVQVMGPVVDVEFEDNDLPYKKTGRYPDETIHYILEMYCQSSIYMTVKWVLGDIYAASPACQKDLLSKQYLESLSKEQRERLAQYFKGRDNDLYTLSMAMNSTDPLGNARAEGFK